MIALRVGVIRLLVLVDHVNVVRVIRARADDSHSFLNGSSTTTIAVSCIPVVARLVLIP